MDEEKRQHYHFGEKIRLMREKRHLTLKAVARQAGVSESLVSQIERNRVSPAIDTLLDIADVLDIPPEYLFSEYRRSRPVSLIHAGERRVVHEEDIIYEEIARPSEKDGQNSIESYIVTVPVAAHTHRGSYGHLGRELGIILAGQGKLHYESKEYALERGDSVSFSAGAPHTLENTGDEPLQALWVVSPAQRFI